MKPNPNTTTTLALGLEAVHQRRQPDRFGQQRSAADEYADSNGDSIRDSNGYADRGADAKPSPSTICRIRTVR